MILSSIVLKTIVGSVYVGPQNTIYEQLEVNFKIFVGTTAKKTVINFRNYKFIEMIDLKKKLLTNYEQMRVANCTHLINMSSLCVKGKLKI